MSLIVVIMWILHGIMCIYMARSIILSRLLCVHDVRLIGDDDVGIS